MSEISIIEAKPKHFSKVRAILKELDAQFWQSNQAVMRPLPEARLTRSRYNAWVSPDPKSYRIHHPFLALRDNQISGFMLLQTYKGPADCDRLFLPLNLVKIEEIVVTKSARRGGVGRELIAYAEFFARTENAHQLVVGTMANQADAVEFYEEIFKNKPDQLVFTKLLKPK